MLSTPESCERADDQRTEWSRADHLLFDQELAVPVFDRTGGAVAALSMRTVKPPDLPALELMAGHLRRAATAAGRTLGNG